MLDKLIDISLKNRFIVLVLAIVILIAGSFIAIDLPVDVFPDLTAPTVTIMTEAHGMATEEVETLVTLPIESSVNGATNVRRVRSSSAPGFSVVWVEFEWGTDILVARQIVNEKIQIAITDLPQEVDEPILAPISSIMGEIMLVSLSLDEMIPTDLTAMDLRTIADFDIRRRLLSINGVSQVIPIGGEVKQYQIFVSPNKLSAFNISLDEVVAAAKESNMNSSGGSYMSAGNEYWIRGIGRVHNLNDLKNSVVALRDEVPILFKDIAEIKIGPAVKFGDASVNAKPAVLLTIQKQPDANTIELTKEIVAALSEIQNSLPNGVIINSNIFKQSDFIETAITNVISSLRDGAILVLIIIFLFLWNIRTTFISIIAIPLSLITTIFVFQIFDIMINTMTLGGMAIAIGALVDDAIIDVENVFRRLKQNSQLNQTEKQNPLSVIYNASKEIRAPMVNATFIIVIVFLPMFFLSGIEGRLLRPMGYAYVTSIFASLLVALTVTPVLSYYLLTKKANFMNNDSEAWIVERLKELYSTVLNYTLKHPKVITIASSILLISTILVLPFLGRSFLPEFNEGAFTLSVVTLPGTSIVESNKIGKLVEEIILSHPEVISTARRTGRAELDEHAQSVNGAEVDVRFNLNGKSKEDFVKELRHSLDAVPGTNITIGQPISHRIDHMLSGTRANIAVKVFGSNLEILRSLANSIENEISKVEGAVDVAVDQEVEVPQTKIKFNRIKMARYGLTVGKLAETIDIAFNGEVASEILEGQNNFKLVVRFDENNRGNIDIMKNVLIDTPLGFKIPLSQVAKVVNEKGPNRISRENVQRKIVVQANVAGRDLRSVVDDMQKIIEEKIDFPQGYFVEFGGQFESEQKATRIITLLTLVSIAAIFLILYMQFNEIKSTLFILVNMPLALIGGIWAVYFTNGIISIASLVGFITLFGIATRNGILMISHYKHLLGSGIEFKEAIIQGSLERLNPILMTAITAGLALVPLALGTGEPGKEIEAPMAIVIIGGLFTSTALNMIVVPSLYFKFGRNFK